MRKPVYAICKQIYADQPAHPCSLISAIVVRFLDTGSMMPVLAIAKISRFLLVSAEQAGLSLN